MTLRLEQSKTDPFRHGTNVILSNPRAIRYMIAYLQHRNQYLARLPLFAGSNGQPLSTAALVSFTQDMIKRSNIPNAHLFISQRRRNQSP